MGIWFQTYHLAGGPPSGNSLKTPFGGGSLDPTLGNHWVKPTYRMSYNVFKKIYKTKEPTGNNSFFCYFPYCFSSVAGSCPSPESDSVDCASVTVLTVHQRQCRLCIMAFKGLQAYCR